MISVALEYTIEAEKNYVIEKMSPFWCHLDKMHGGEVFHAATLFPPEKLPIKKQIIEQMLNFCDYETLGAAMNAAQEMHERWVWSLSSNVYQ